MKKTNIRLGRILGIVGITFIVLKLCNVIAWPWIAVLIPFMIWGGILLVAILLVLVGVILIGLGRILEGVNEATNATLDSYSRFK